MEWLEHLTANAEVATRPGFDPSILRHSGIWGAADEALSNKVLQIAKYCTETNSGTNPHYIRYYPTKPISQRKKLKNTHNLCTKNL